MKQIKVNRAATGWTMSMADKECRVLAGSEKLESLSVSSLVLVCHDVRRGG